ncbi:MAG: hypothetical protein KGL39_03010 [Patescibacteria group bacterium]|nr:hypothetical protein [Patescibacteria group bacterium]
MVNVAFNVLDEATPAIRAKLAQCDPHRVAIRVAVPLARHWRNHLASLPKNKHGWPSTGFWEDAARRVKGVALSNAVELSSDKLGLRQRLYGGIIEARNAANLSIPITAEAYGKLPGEFDDLVIVVIADGRKFLAKWQGDGKKPNVIILRGKGAGKSSATARAAKHLNLKFMYVLKPSVYQAANPNVVPPDMEQVALQAVKDYVDMKIK